MFFSRDSVPRNLESCTLFASTCLIKFDLLVQVMATRPRSDIYINLPALEKLDAMLIVSSDPNYFLH
jgi:hypothetical protein